jgi:hypothetical protein
MILKRALSFARNTFPWNGQAAARPRPSPALDIGTAVNDGNFFAPEYSQRSYRLIDYFAHRMLLDHPPCKFT